MKLTNICKNYGEKAAISNISIEIEIGKICAVLGESGAGKSTLLSIIAGMTSYEGTVEGVGRTSYLFQSPKLLPNLTVEENLKFVLPKQRWGDILPMLEKVGLEKLRTSRPGALSGGERQRVAIARAFLYPHDTLLMDEPFSSLDLALKKSLIELCAALWRESGSTVLFVTHDVHEAAVLSHRALVLRGGRLAGDFAVEGEPPRDFLVTSPLEGKLTAALMQN